MFSSSRSAEKQSKLTPYFYILPGVLAMFISIILPGIFTIYYSFTNYSLKHFSDWKLIGFSNYERILVGSAKGELWSVLGWTCTWAILSIFLSLAVGMVLALLLNNKNVKERNLYRLLLILPWALPSTITLLSWRGLLNSSFGPINRFLADFGIASIPWLTNPLMAKISCLMVNLWISFPFMMITCLGALQAIPEELYDAGKVDGANSWKMFWNITFPLMNSSTKPLLVSGFAMQFVNFGVIFLLTDGGPFIKTSTLSGSTDLLSTYMYKMAFASANFDYGMSAACGVLLFLIVGTITFVNAKVSRSFDEVEA